MTHATLTQSVPPPPGLLPYCSPGLSAECGFDHMMAEELEGCHWGTQPRRVATLQSSRSVDADLSDHDGGPPIDADDMFACLPAVWSWKAGFGQLCSSVSNQHQGFDWPCYPGCQRFSIPDLLSGEREITQTYLCSQSGVATPALGSLPRRRTWFHKEHKTEINTETAIIMAWIFASQTTLSLENYWIRLLSPILIYLVAKYIWRAFLCPLANFPGPRMAGITKLYEAYHVLIKNDWLDNLVSLHEQYGPVVRIGPNELHFIDHKFSLEHHKRPDLLKCDNYYGILNKLLGGLVSPSDHSKRAASMRPIFSGQTLAEFAPTMDKHIESLHSRLTDAAMDTEAVNLTHFLWAYTNDVMLSYVTEEDNGWLKNYDLGAVHDTTRAFSAIDLATTFRCMPPLKMMLDVFPAIRSYSPLGWLDELVASHLRPIVKSWDDENSHQGILSRIFNEIGNETHAVQESSQAIFIGNESLLSNLTFVVHHLVKNPECVKKIRAELDTLDIGTYGHRVWRDQKIFSLKYLDAVCKESTRLSSPGWHRQPRQSQTPIDYHGTIIPAMTSLSFTLHLLEHDPELFPEPDTFKPERWLGYSEESKAARSHSVTFGTGTRTCLGQQIANKVLRKTVAFLVYNFNITLWNEKLDRTEGYRYLSTYPKKGHEGYMRVRLNPRFSCDS